MPDLVAGWRLATGTLTVLPSGRVTMDREATTGMLIAAPLAVAPIGIAAGLLAYAGHLLGAPALLTGLVVVGALVVSTRAMHVDGIADVADGAAAGWTPERAREVLKRGDVGPAGATALILVLGIEAAAVADLSTSGAGVVQLAGVFVLSRALLAIPCRRGVPAMPGSSMGKPFAEVAPGWLPLTQAVGVPLLATGLAVLTGAPWWLGALAGMAAATLAFVVTDRCRRRFGGINGDVLGTCLEAAFVVLLVVFSCG